MSNCHFIFGQCCSLGNPQVGSLNTGVLPKNNLNIGVFYKSGKNETYFRQNVRLINYGLYKSSTYDFSGLQIGYGLTERITLEHDFGYFHKKELVYYDPVLNDLARNGRGFSNGIAGIKFMLLKENPYDIGLICGASIKYPFSTKMQSFNGVDLPIEIQPSTRTFGWIVNVSLHKIFSPSEIFVFVNHSYDSNFPNPNNYAYGSMHATNLSLSYNINSDFNVSLTLRNELKFSDKTSTGVNLASEGSNTILLAPMLSYQIINNYNLMLFCDIPIYKYYFGEQLSMKYAFGVMLNKKIAVTK